VKKGIESSVLEEPDQIIYSKMKFLVLSILVISQVSFVCGWGATGHMIIGQLAWNMLSDDTQNILQKFIGTNASITLASIAPLPDDYRYTPQGNWSEPCHFCDLPKNATNFTMQYCPKFCVVKSIGNYTKRLKEDLSNPFQCDYTLGVEPCALEFLTHFVGDVHQPLHVSYTYDKGGNDVAVDFFGTQTNLHHVWDTSMIDWWMYQGNWTDLVQNLTDIIQNEPNMIKKYLAQMDPLRWADESFQYVLNDVYNYDPEHPKAEAHSETQFLDQRKKNRTRIQV